MRKREITTTMVIGAAVALILAGCSGAGTAQGAAGNQTTQEEIAAQTETESPEETETADSEENGVEASAQPGSNENQEAAENGLQDGVGREELTFPIGQEINSDTFTGTAYISPMISYDDVYHFPQTNNITFEPGARSGWHSHGGMVILGTGGVGYYQEEGKPAQIIRKGDVVVCPEGVRHWHGAAPDSWFSQIVIYDMEYTLAEDAKPETPMSDEEYENLETVEYTGRAVTGDDGFMFQKADTALESETFNGPAYVSNIIGDDNVAGAPGLHYVVFEPGVTVNTNPELVGVEWFDRISDEEYGQLGS